MPTGNVPLLEAVKNSDDMKVRGVIQTLIQESPILEQISWIAFAGNALQRKIEATLPSVAFRQVNAGYTKSWGSDEENFWGVAILGGEVFVDNFLVDVVDTVESTKAKQFVKMAKASAMTYDDFAINGTGASNSFKGVKQLIDDLYAVQKLSNGTATISLDKLDEAFDLLRMASPDAVWLNRTVRRQITQKARTTVTGISLIDVGTDVFGRQVTMYNDTPLRIIGDKVDGTPILPFTETSSTTSVYLVKFGEDNVSGLLGKGGTMTVRDFGETELSPGHLGRLEWYPGLGVFDRYAVARLHAITAV